MIESFEEFLSRAFANSPDRKKMLVYCGFCDELYGLDQDCHHQRVKRWLVELQCRLDELQFQYWLDNPPSNPADNKLTNDD